MSDDMTARLSLPFLAAAQAQKEIVHNEALQALDALVQAVVQRADLSAPPATPADGDCWIVGALPTGAWSGNQGRIAQWTIGGWRFHAPASGWRCHVAALGHDLVHDGTAWNESGIGADGLYVGGTRTVAAQQPAISDPLAGATVDSEARAAIAGILAAMRAHGLIAS